MSSPTWYRMTARGEQPGRPPTVLVVEDEVSVRLLTCRMLRGLGYQCEEASDGREALRLIRRREHPYALVLTDVVMPVMGGDELCRRLAEEKPDQPVLCMSAYPNTTLAGHGLLPTGRAFLQKPFLPAALATEIRNLLGSTVQPAH